MITNIMETSDRSLKDKRIVLLGGTSGFGLATAKVVAAEDAKVVVVSSSRQRVDNALTQLPDGSEGYAANLSDETQVKKLFDDIGEFDHLVYSAGENLQFGDLFTLDIEASKQFFNTRFWGAIMAAKYGGKNIRKGGSITLTNGTVGLRPIKGWAIASSITGAVESLTRALAVELAPIRVNAVCAGVVRTDLWGNIPEADREAFFQDFGNKLLTGRVGEANDIAEAFLYLIRNSYSTGQVVVADGGGVLV
jgi:NAD(P)-dependent dehydrogenase (short-subunit alcohol dehydrogenase family)